MCIKPTLLSMEKIYYQWNKFFFLGSSHRKEASCGQIMLPLQGAVLCAHKFFPGLWQAVDKVLSAHLLKALGRGCVNSQYYHQCGLPNICGSSEYHVIWAFNEIGSKFLGLRLVAFGAKEWGEKSLGLIIEAVILLFLKEVKAAQSCPTLCNPMDYTVHGILQARTLEWVAFPFSRGSSQPRDQTQVSHITGRFFTSWATREVQEYWSG